MGVPEIDMAGAATDAATRRAIVDAMAEAWRTWGVFLVVNHGVSPEVVDGARQQAMRVFHLPMERKHRAMRAPGEFAGYGNGAGTKVAQAADTGSESVRLRFPGPDTRAFGEKLWPDDYDAADEFCEKYEACSAASLKLAREVVELLVEALPEVDRPHILRYFPEPCVGSVRLNYYPSSTTLGLPAHADVAALALLHQCDGGGGLQVQKDEQWVTVQARSEAFVVIMGTVFKIFTNGDQKACQHQAVQEGGKERLSMVFALWPEPSLAMTPAPTFLDAHQQRLCYQPLTFLEFWDAREANLLDPLRSITIDVD